MGLSVSAGRIIMTDAAGNVRFDTAEKLFVPTNFVAASLTLPNYSASTNWDGSNRASLTDTSGGTADNTYNIGSVSSNADTVRGAFQVSVSYGGLSSSRWYNASGSYVHMWQGGAYGSPTLACGAIDVCASAVYTFFCSGGMLKLREQIHIFAEPGYCTTGANNNTLTMIGPTISCKLFCGTFV